MRSVLCLLLLLPLFGNLSVLEAKDAPRDEGVLPGGSFERLVPAKSPKDIGHGVWTLAADKRMPSGWSCNGAYPGTLEVIQDAPRHGSHAIRIAAGAKRDAQIFKPAAVLRPGTWYRVSMFVRAGTASLLMYQYAQGRQLKSRLLGSVTAKKGEWREVSGFFTPDPDGFKSVSVALLVPREGSAEIDDVRVHELDGPVAKAGAKPITLGTKASRLTLSANGTLQSFLVAGKEQRVEGDTGSFLVVEHGQGPMPIATLTKRGSSLVARFPDSRVQVKLKAKSVADYLHFEVLDAKPKSLQSVTLRVPVRGYRVRDTWMPGTYDERGGVALMATTPNTHTRLGRHGKAVVPQARWSRQHGIRGACALLAAGGSVLLPAIQNMQKVQGLPAPRVPSAYGAETASVDWARSSPALKKSYLFITHLGMGDIDNMIQYARLGGFGMIMLHRKTWRASAGHEEIARTAFPEGLPTLTAVCERIHAAGLGVGLHLYGPAVSLNDAYVTPVPDKRLFSYEVARLASKAGASDTELAVDRLPALPRIGGADLYPGNLLRLGNEIIRWKRIVPGTPVRITGCERGALGTKASAHRGKASVHTLALNNGGLLVDPDSTLPAEMGAHLARVVNACKADLVYFDAAGGNVPGRKPENWYYLNKVLLANCAGFDHGTIVQTGQGPGRQLLWHLVPRSASADGHGDLKRYLDQRMPGILQMRRTHTAADIGWYALDIHGRPDELEYVCAKALALDASVSVQAYRGLLDTHPRAREVFEMLEAWERRRLAGDVPEKLKKLLAEKGRDVRLVETDDGWTLWEVAYEPFRAVTAINGKANQWVLNNKRKQEVELTLEIERVRVAATPAEHAASTAIEVDALGSAVGFQLKDASKLAPHILMGGRAAMAVGFARRGTTFSIEAMADKAVGGEALALQLESTIGGAGWGATGRTLSAPVDLSGARSLGMWVHGDGRGASLTLTLVDAAGARVRYPIPLDYLGWRFQSFERKGPAAMDWAKVAHVIFELGHVPPHATIKARVAALRAMPTLRKPTPLSSSILVDVGPRELTLGAPLEPGQALTVDALGRGVWWPGGMEAGSREKIAGGPIRLPPGATTLRIRLKNPETYAGDLHVRFGRTWLLGR